MTKKGRPGFYTGSLILSGCTLTISSTGSLNIASGVTAALRTGGRDGDPTYVAQPMANWKPVPGSTDTVTNPSGLWSVTVTNHPPALYRARAM